MQGVQRHLRSLVAIACLSLLAPGTCGCALPQHASQRLASVADDAAAIDELPADATIFKDPSPSPVTVAKSDAQSRVGKREISVDAERDSGKDSSPPARDAASKTTSPPQIDAKALAAVADQLKDVRALDPAGCDDLLTDMQGVDPKLWPMLVEGFRASAQQRQQKKSTDQIVSAPGPPPSHESRQASATPALPVSHRDAKLPADWRQSLDATISSLEAALAESPESNDDRRQVSLRLLYLLSGQQDKAMQPLAGHDSLVQEFWSQEIDALSTYLDANRVSDRARRAAEAAEHHWEASRRLSQQGNLVVRNLAFCTEVMSYGVYTPFDHRVFQPGQPVLLYAEVENFVSQPTPRGHHTALRSSYQIVDSRGQKIQNHEFPLMEEHCQNARRDFFIAYEAVRLPVQISEGTYSLTLTIEDVLGHKMGHASLDFQIRQEDRPRGAARPNLSGG